MLFEMRYKKEFREYFKRFTKYLLNGRREEFFDEINASFAPIDTAAQDVIWMCLTGGLTLLELRESEYVQQGLADTDGSELRALAIDLSQRRGDIA